MGTLFTMTPSRNRVGLALALTCLILPPCALASGTVGAGTPDSCTEAALDAALSGGGDVIFNCGTSPATITVTNTKQIVTKTSINGGGRITISGGGTSDVMFIKAHVTARLADLTISDAPFGFAVDNAGNLTATNCAFTHNLGSALSNVGRLSVTNSTFVANGDPSGGASGIFNNGGALTVTNSTFANNTSGGPGGAIFNGSRLTVANCTFANNSAFSGSAIHNAGKLTVINSTFSNNTAGAGGGTINSPGAKAVFKNSIIANSASGENCVVTGVTFVDRGHNLDSGHSCGFSTSRGSLSNTDPKLDPAGLADNGGPTQTIAVESGSPVINAGKLAVCNAAPVKGLDQRGFVRPGTGKTSCSIGAYEFDSPGPRRR